MKNSITIICEENGEKRFVASCPALDIEVPGISQDDAYRRLMDEMRDYFEAEIRASKQMGLR